MNAARIVTDDRRGVCKFIQLSLSPGVASPGLVTFERFEAAEYCRRFMT